MRDLNVEAIELLHRRSRQQSWRTRGVTKDKRYRTSSVTVQDYVVLDFQTTGIRVGADQIIQITAIKYVKHELTDILNTIVNPQRHISVAVTQFTGISNEMAKTAPTIEQKIEELLDFIGDFPILAHDASFDMGFLYAIENWTEVNIPDYTVIDTVKLARKIITETPNHKLTTLTNFLKFEYDAHDALGDCFATVAIYQYCINRHDLDSKA